ncbi:MAG: hypothetical protein RIC85_05825 [Gammaproteobacteria bacterium]
MLQKSYSKYWRLYSGAIDAGTIDEGSKAEFRVSEQEAFGLRQSPGTSSHDLQDVQKLAKLFRIPRSNQDALDELMTTKDYKLFELGMEFLDATWNARIARVQEIANSGFNVNFADPASGRTALHDIAFSGSRRLLRAFLEAEQINFLVTDNDGKLPSMLADGNDRVIARFLRKKERAQAREQGISYDHLK